MSGYQIHPDFTNDQHVVVQTLAEVRRFLKERGITGKLVRDNSGEVIREGMKPWDEGAIVAIRQPDN
jgi:hypothetical protein